jgi:hypothetical protein
MVMAGLASPAQATQAVAKEYSSCADLLVEYPNGVAKDKKARKQAVKGDFAKPKVSKSLYGENGARLDRDKDGVMCEQEVLSSEVAECTEDDTALLRGFDAYVERIRSKRACGEWNKGQARWALMRARSFNAGLCRAALIDPLEFVRSNRTGQSGLRRYGLDGSYTPWALEEWDTVIEIVCLRG